MTGTTHGTEQTRPRFVGLGEGVLRGFRGYRTPSGRATRAEFWWFAVFTFVASWLSDRLDAVIAHYTDTDWHIVAVAFFFVMVAPTLMVAVRRLHDIDRSGWWLLLAIPPLGVLVLLWFFLRPASPGPNEHGPLTT